jgi:hypothetical protein
MFASHALNKVAVELILLLPNVRKSADAEPQAHVSELPTRSPRSLTMVSDEYSGRHIMIMKRKSTLPLRLAGKVM